MRKNTKIVTGLILALGVSSIANAVVYDVTAVLSGSEGGFGFSGFHFAGEDLGSLNSKDHDGNAMTGTNLMNITSVNSGTYDTDGGIFNAVFGLADMSTVTISGMGLNFDGSGLLSAGSTLNIDFSAADTAALFDAAIDFSPGYVCCGSNANDPNSFKDAGSADKLMSLWGADFSNLNPTGPNIGLDLRIELTTVPVPAAVWLFGTGLLGLVGVARRRA